jgi:hypothetical protein
MKTTGAVELESQEVIPQLVLDTCVCMLRIQIMSVWYVRLIAIEID